MYICNNGNNLIYLNRSLPQCELSFFKIFQDIFNLISDLRIRLKLILTENF